MTISAIIWDPALEVNNIYPQMVAKAFCDGMEAEGRGKDMVHLARCGWARKSEVRHAALVGGCAQHL